MLVLRDDLRGERADRCGANFEADAERSLELALLIGDRYGEALSRHDVAWAASLIADSERSVSEYERAIQVYSEIGNTAGASPSILNLAAGLGWCGDYGEAFRLLDEHEALALEQPWGTLQMEAHRGSLLLRAGRLEPAERHLLLAREHAQQLETAPYAAHIQVRLAEIDARSGRLEQARAGLILAKAALERLELPSSVAEVDALSARVQAEMQNPAGARHSIAAATASVVASPSLELSTKFWWDLAAASALIGDAPAAHGFAQSAARKFCDEALAMRADLAECYGRLPWHVDAFAYLAGREVSLTLAG